MLDGALARVATTDQERYVTQRLLGDAFGRRRDVRLALVLGLVVLGLVGAIAVAGALLQRPSIPVGPLSNGPVIFGANSADDDLSGSVSDPRTGDRDVYRVDMNGRIHRIVGDGADSLSVSCVTVSPDGAHLAYRAVDLTTVTPTQAPVPEGQAFGPAPLSAGPLQFNVHVADLDQNGAVVGETRPVAAAAAPDSIPSCPAWSPDSARLAFRYIPSGDGDVTSWLATLDGQATPFDPGVGWNTLAWSPNGPEVALATGDDVVIAQLDGGASRRLIRVPTQSLAWSPDGSRIAAWTMDALTVVTPDGRELFQRDLAWTGEEVSLWSPDGSQLAVQHDGKVSILAADGSTARTIAVDVAGLFPGSTSEVDFTPSIALLAWSPLGDRLLISASPSFDTSALITVAASGDGRPVVLTPPTVALVGLVAGHAGWQGVHR